MGKGDRGERELANRLEDEFGYRALRAPSSGAGTKRERPDVLAGKDGRVLVFEAKTSGGKPVYVPKEEVEALIDYAAGFGAEAYIAVRWSSNSIRDTTVYVANPHDMHDAGGSYRAKYEDCQEDNWTTLSDIA